MAAGGDRTHTNAFVYRSAERELNRGNKSGDKHKTLIKLSDYYDIQRRTLIADIIKADAADPIREITIEAEGLRQIDYGFRRVGGKRNNWWEKGIENYWDKIKKELPPALRYASYNQQDPIQIQHLIEAARRDMCTRRDSQGTDLQARHARHMSARPRQEPAQTRHVPSSHGRVAFVQGSDFSVHDHQ